MFPTMNTEAIGGEWVGRVINGKYALLKWLGNSGSGAVFLTAIEGPATHRAAIRLLPALAANSEARFDAWVAAATLSHPHLMPLFDSGRCQIDDAAFFYAVTGYAEEDLSEVLPHRHLSAKEAAEMLDPVLDALSYLHENGLVHGHLKPSNILVVDDKVKLSSDTLEAIGSPTTHLPPSDIYDAPERSTQPVAPSADLWSLGATLVEALTQHPPAWDVASDQDPIVPEAVPQPFAQIAQECLRQNPERRCTLSEIQARLHPGRTHSAEPYIPEKFAPEITERTAPAPAVEANAAPEKPRPRLPQAVALVALAIIAGIVLLPHKHHTSTPMSNEELMLGNATPPPEAPQSPQPAEKPEVAHQVLPDVPPTAQATIWGTIVVKVRVAVDASGKVTNAVLDTPGPSHYFAKLSLQAAQQWQFMPAIVDGQPAPSVWLLEFQFTNSSTNAVPVEVSP